MKQEAERDLQSKERDYLLEVKEKWFAEKDMLEKKIFKEKENLQNLEKSLLQQQSKIERKQDFLNRDREQISKKEKEINSLTKKLKEEEARYQTLINQALARLEEISNLNQEQAKKLLLADLENEVRRNSADMEKRIIETAKTNAEREAKNIITFAIQRCSSEQVTETTVSVISLPSEEMKGRIIGREGRNIRAFEKASGVNVIIDDTPEAITLSAFDPVRREIARLSMEKLIQDGRIHPARIEEVVKKITEQMEVNLKEKGEEACFELGISKINPYIVRLLGKLHYRTSYGQNCLSHSKEVAYLCGFMAGELGLDINLSKRAGLLHDIGKAVDLEMEGTHAIIGSILAKKHDESNSIVNAIASHHEEEPPLIAEAVLVQAADAISSARPGARRETLESYIKRLTQLEDLAENFKGVEKAYAIQAGRELRIIVKNEDLDEAETFVLASTVARKIEEQLEYPGQIKVTVIREIRAVDIAK